MWARIGGADGFRIWLDRGKDKTFFFFNRESGVSASGNTPTRNIVPSDAYSAGDLSALKDAKGNAIAIKDVFAGGAVVAGNKIPTSRLSFQSRTFLQFEPTANFSSGLFNFLSTRYSAVSHQHNYTTRIDHNFRAKDILTGRYTFNDTYEAGTPFWGHDERNNLGRTQNVALTYTRIVSPDIVNELRGGWHRFNEAEVFGTTNDPNYDVVGKMKLPLVSRVTINFGLRYDVFGRYKQKDDRFADILQNGYILGGVVNPTTSIRPIVVDFHGAKRFPRSGDVWRGYDRYGRGFASGRGCGSGGQSGFECADMAEMV